LLQERLCECGFAIIDESNGGAAERVPCPRCGSLTRIVSAGASLTVGAFIRAEASVVTYPENLLELCRRLIDEGQYGVSVVVAHMACEVATERALTISFALKELAYLEEAIRGLLNGYSLTNTRIRKLYTDVTGDHIERQAFWSEFMNSAKRRNTSVHRGAFVAPADAERSYKACLAFVSHIAKA